MTCNVLLCLARGSLVRENKKQDFMLRVLGSGQLTGHKMHSTETPRNQHRVWTTSTGDGDGCGRFPQRARGCSLVDWPQGCHFPLQPQSKATELTSPRVESSKLCLCKALCIALGPGLAIPRFMGVRFGLCDGTWCQLKQNFPSFSLF